MAWPNNNPSRVRWLSIALLPLAVVWWQSAAGSHNPGLWLAVRLILIIDWKGETTGWGERTVISEYVIEILTSAHLVISRKNGTKPTATEQRHGDNPGPEHRVRDSNLGEETDHPELISALGYGLYNWGSIPDRVWDVSFSHRVQTNSWARRLFPQGEAPYSA